MALADEDVQPLKQQTISLIELPRELRDRLYAECVVAFKTTICHPIIHGEGVRSLIWDIHPARVPSLALANRTVRDELYVIMASESKRHEVHLTNQPFSHDFILQQAYIFTGNLLFLIQDLCTHLTFKIFATTLPTAHPDYANDTSDEQRIQNLGELIYTATSHFANAEVVVVETVSVGETKLARKQRVGLQDELLWRMIALAHVRVCWVVWEEEKKKEIVLVDDGADVEDREWPVMQVSGGQVVIPKGLPVAKV